MGNESSIFDSVVSSNSEKTVDPDTSTPDFETLRAKIFGTKRKSSKSKAGSTTKETPTEKELADLFSGENWEEVSSLYFDARFATTGHGGFLLSPGQNKTLGLTLGKSMQMLLKIDPGYIALMIFTMNFGGLIAQKEVSYRHLLKEEERKNRGKI